MAERQDQTTVRSETLLPQLAQMLERIGEIPTSERLSPLTKKAILDAGDLYFQLTDEGLEGEAETLRQAILPFGSNLAALDLGPVSGPVIIKPGDPLWRHIEGSGNPVSRVAERG